MQQNPWLVLHVIANHEKLPAKTIDLDIWRGLNVGTHHSDFVIFFIEIVQHEIAQRNHSAELFANTDR